MKQGISVRTYRSLIHHAIMDFTTLTHWGQVTQICVSILTIIGSDNGLSPERRQAIIWTDAGVLVIEPLGTNFIGILIGIQTFSFKTMHLKMSSVKWRPFGLGLNVLTTNNMRTCTLDSPPIRLLIRFTWRDAFVRDQNKCRSAHTRLTHCTFVMPYGIKDPDHHGFRYWLVIWWYRANTRTSIDFLFNVFCGNRQKKMLKGCSWSLSVACVRWLHIKNCYHTPQVLLSWAYFLSYKSPTKVPQFYRK